MKKKSLCIQIPIEEKKLLNIKLKIQKELPVPIINKMESQFLKTYKNKIDSIEVTKGWDIAKKITNKYELIHIPTNKKKKNDSIAFYNPLSRSYYKLIEIFEDFRILDKYVKKKIKTSHIAEGPGGFIEAMINKRKNYCDDVNAITLKSFKKEIPGWRKAKCFLEKNPNIKINYGSDGTGNIYKIENIKHYRECVGFNSCDIVTADGGFDFSIDFNKQEELSSRLIFCEIVLALSVQKKGGIFICKLFDSFTNMTIKMLWLLNSLYEKIIITKPYTSRPANSEKYIIALNFGGININYLERLYNIVHKWNDVEQSGYYISDIFEESLDSRYVDILENYNKFNVYHQIKTIRETLSIINKEILVDNEDIKNNQIKIALDWCLKYKIDINFASNYLLDQQEYYKYYDPVKFQKWKLNNSKYI